MNAQFLIVGNTCGKPLAPRESCGFRALFQPLGLGAARTQIVVTAQPGGMILVGLHGFGALPSVLDVFPNFLDFPAVALTSPTPALASFTVLNTGAAPVGSVMPQLIGPDAGDFEVTSDPCLAIDPHASCVVNVRFAPKTVGSKQGALTIAVKGLPDMIVRLTGTGAP
jgi:hypothetical protein